MTRVLAGLMMAAVLAAPMAQGETAMKMIDAYPLITAHDIAKQRDFYVRHFGASVGFEASWFVYLVLPAGEGRALAFMTSDHPSTPPGPEPFDGRGMILTFQVEDAAAAHEALHASGAPSRAVSHAPIRRIHISRDRGMT